MSPASLVPPLASVGIAHALFMLGLAGAFGLALLAIVVSRRAQRREREARLRVGAAHEEIGQAQATRLERTEERLRLVLSGAAQGIFELDLLTGATTVTPDFLARLDLPPEAPIATFADWLALMHPDDRAGLDQVYQASVAGHDPGHHSDFRVQRANGGWTWVRSIGRIVSRAPDGRASHMTGILADVTASLLEQARITHLASSYATLSELNHAIVHASCEEELLLHLCQSAVVSGGFSMAFVAMINETTGAVEPAACYGDTRGYLEGIHVSASTDTPYGHGPTGTAIRENRPCWCQTYMDDPGTQPWPDRCAEGAPWGSAAALPLRRHGQAVGAITLYMPQPGAFDEATQRLLTMMVNDVNFALDHFAREAAGQHARQEADATRAQLEATIDAMPDLIFELGLDGRFYSYHTPRADLLAVPPAAFLGHTLEESLPPVVARKLAEAIAEANRTGYSTGTTYELELAGGSRWFDVSIARKKVAAGEQPRFVAVVRDITDARQAEAERVQLEAQLRHSQKLEALGQLAGGLAHDLNNVLTPIIIGTSLIRDHVRDAQAREILDTTEQCARRGADIIRRLLTFARGTPGDRKPVAVSDLFRDMARIIRETFARNIQLELDAAEGAWAIHGDSTQLQQVLMNLCVNARDAMPDGGTLTLGAANVTVADPPTDAGATDLRPGPYVRLRVSDTGTGMTPSQIEHIFEPFFTTKPIGQGTGLGLPTVLGIVRSHGGFLRVNSAPGTGTTFELYLPPAVDAVRVEVAPVAPLRQGLGELVLVVDDEAAVRSSVRRSLVAQGYRVVVAAHGREGLEQFALHAADIRIVVTDMMMPVMDGLTMMEGIRTQAPGTPVIVMTGLLDRAVTRGDSGPDAILSKPFDPETLLELVGRLCQPAIVS